MKVQLWSRRREKGCKKVVKIGQERLLKREQGYSFHCNPLKNLVGHQGLEPRTN